VQLGRAVAELAARREESRGGHWRSDHPAPVDAWRVRQTLARTADGGLEAGLLAVPEDGGGPVTVTVPERAEVGR
jgi:L-aspartate oxidase